MEIIQNRYGNDRVIEKISPTKLRITGESIIVRTSKTDDGNYTMYDFEGGPCLTVGGKLRYLGSNWEIIKIVPEISGKEDLSMVVLDVKL